MSDQPQIPDDEIIQHQRDRPVVPCWMTKREHFASLAMQGILSNNRAEFTDMTIDLIAPVAVRCADALIAALEK